MTEYRIDAQLFSDMVITAANYLEQNKQTLNDLNVFPVPDGDTGTNMTLTLISAAKEVSACQTNYVGEVIAALSMGALKGARGNSGVILSQLFRGFARSVSKDKQFLVAEDFANAIIKGVESAYKAVMKPKEGTILTVARAMAEEAERQMKKGANMLKLIDAVIDAGQEMLKRTPNMLPVLKEAGVVDAGGAGLLVIYKGFKMAIDGEEVSKELDFSVEKDTKPAPASSLNTISTADIEFGYCTEFFIIDLEKDVTEESIEHFRDKLAMIGDSIVVVGSPELVKVHVHTNVPGKALQYALRLGQLSKIKIDNMREEHNSLSNQPEKEEPAKEKKPIAMVAVAAGEGLSEILSEFMVDELIYGGQSMNPSIEDIHKAIEQAPSDNVIVFPNNKNVILAAQQAKELTEKNVVVIPTKSFPQGLSAVLAFNPEESISENEETMNEAISLVKSGEITVAVRDTVLHGTQIKEGDLLGLLDGDIAVVGQNTEQVLMELLQKMVSDDNSIISIYYGEDVTEEEAAAIGEKAEETYGDLDVEVLNGKQSVYHYIISVE